MTTDILASEVINLSGPAVQVSGRKHDVWGAREVGLYRITTVSTSFPGSAGGYTFDPKSFGFQGVPATVIINKHVAVADIVLASRYEFFYDYVAKKIQVNDRTDSDVADGDDLHLITLDIIVIGE